MSIVLFFLIGFFQKELIKTIPIENSEERIRHLIKKVRQIEIQTRRKTDHLFTGEYHSSFKGSGMAFSEVRRYEFGDDVRRIDWNVTARLNEPYIKVFEEERELLMMLLVDISQSENFGSKNSSKREYSAEVSALLAFAALKNNDKVGLILFSDEVELFIPPKKGKSHVLRIIREILEYKASSKKTNLSAALKYLSDALRKKAICFVLSDYDDSNYNKALKFAARKHDISGVRIYDELEQTYPSLGLIKMRDLETNKAVLVNTSSKSFKRNRHEHNSIVSEEFKNRFKRAGAGSIELENGQPFTSKFLAYFKSR